MPPPFSPTFISGIFGWYKATNVTNTASGVFAWQDLSGSGNDLSLNTSFGPAPILVANVLNGLPAVRFSGGGYLGTTAANTSLNLAPSSLSAYCVFSTTDPYTTQTIISDNHFGGTNNQNKIFHVGLNYVAPSSWFYSWGHKTLFADFSYIEAYSPTLGQAFQQPANAYVIRADLFSNSPSSTGPLLAPNGPGFYFDRFGVQVPASAVSQVFSVGNTNTILSLGFDPDGDTFFTGDIVEAILFNNNTVDSTDPSGTYFGTLNSHEQLIAYLTQEYLTASSGAAQSPPLSFFNLDHYGTVFDNPDHWSPGPLLLPPTGSGGSTILQSNINFVADGNIQVLPRERSQQNISFVGDGNLSVSAIKKSPPISGTFPIYFHLNYFGTQFDNPSYWSPGPFKPAANPSINQGCTLFMQAQAAPVASSAPTFPLFLEQGGTPPIPFHASGSRTLFISTINYASGVGRSPLFLLNSTPSLTGHMPLYIGGSGPPVSSVMTPLFLGNMFAASGSNIKLWTFSSGFTSGGFPLFIERSETSLVPLFIHGKSASSGRLNLYLISASSVFRSTSLFVEGGHNQTAPMPLFIEQIPHPTSTGNFPLFIFPPQNTLGISGIYRDVSLYMGSTVRGAIPLFVGVGKAQLPRSFLPLYIAGPITTGTKFYNTSLYLENNYIFVSKHAKLFSKGLGDLDGGSISQGHMPLFIDPVPMRAFNLFIDCKSTLQHSINMAISGVFNHSGATPFYTTGSLNSGHVPLYISVPGSSIQSLLSDIYFDPDYFSKRYFDTDYFSLLAHLVGSPSGLATTPLGEMGSLLYIHGF